MNEIVTRIAPSPTGPFHIGTARTALYNYLLAKQNNGKFIVRFEDTDKERSEEKYVDDIKYVLKWLGMEVDLFAKQSERTDIYHKYILKLIASGDAYRSKEPSKADPSKEVEVIRFKNKYTEVTFKDELRGEIATDISHLKDFVIARSDRDPLYHLAVVIDDLEMGVTHILRGDDHIANTPRQLVLINALGGKVPKYLHIPLIHSPLGGKLSKRKHSTSISAFEKRGFLPEAMINFLAFMGWNPGGERELFNLEELIKEFSIQKLHKQEAIANEDKLKWFNKQYILKLSPEKFSKYVLPIIRKKYFLASFLKKESTKVIFSELRERISAFEEIYPLLEEGEYSYLYRRNKYDFSKLLKYSTDPTSTSKILVIVHNKLKDLTVWDEDSVKEAVWKYAEETGRAEVLWPMRLALSGREKSSSPFLIASVIGKKESLKRIKIAYTNL